MSRSEESEREFLLEAVKLADPEKATAFLARVHARLRKGAEEYGDLAFREKTIPQMLAEAREEGEDVPAWLTLAAQLIDDDPALIESDAHHLRLMLVAASAKAMEVWQILDLADEFYSESARKVPA